ncbi:MAG: hypothetical protein JNJ46_06405 [Myxococcales bacterium]|nr:hypothetical protein [Myxococcales bacterium]
MRMDVLDDLLDEGEDDAWDALDADDEAYDAYDAYDAYAEGAEERWGADYADGGESFTRIRTQIRRRIVRSRPGVSRTDIPRGPGPRGPAPVPRIAHGEVTTYANEPMGAGQLLQHGTQGWLRGRRAVAPPTGNRGIATVNPDGSVTWTVYAPNMRTILYRRAIAGPGYIAAAAAVGIDNQAAQTRENAVRALLSTIPTIGGGPPQIFRSHATNVAGPDLLPSGSDAVI